MSLMTPEQRLAATVATALDVPPLPAERWTETSITVRRPSPAAWPPIRALRKKPPSWSPARSASNVPGEHTTASEPAPAVDVESE